MGLFIFLLALYIFVLPSIFLYYAYKLWKKGKNKMSIFFIIIAFAIVSPIVCDIGCQYCGLEKEQAYNDVLKSIQHRNLDINKIQYIGHSGSCRYDFKYEDNNVSIDYSILSTWLHGVKTTSYTQEKNVTNLK